MTQDLSDLKLTDAAPLYGIGARVIYTDQHGRRQFGEVERIEASWSGYRSNPLIIYTVSHPTYRNKRMYAGEDQILCEASPPAGRAALQALGGSDEQAE